MGGGNKRIELMLRSRLVDKARFDLEPSRKGFSQCELFLKTDQLPLGK